MVNIQNILCKKPFDYFVRIQSGLNQSRTARLFNQNYANVIELFKILEHNQLILLIPKKKEKIIKLTKKGEQIQELIRLIYAKIN